MILNNIIVNTYVVIVTRREKIDDKCFRQTQLTKLRIVYTDTGNVANSKRVKLN